MSLVIVDTGCANLASVSYAFERLGASAVITDDAESITSAERVVLPGVGSAPFAAPHMGWNTLSPLKDDPILKGVTEGDFAYFVHSFAAPISDATLVSSEYGSPFSAIVRQNNVWGCQFRVHLSGFGRQSRR